MTPADVYRPSGRIDGLRLFLFAVAGVLLIAVLCDVAFRLDRARCYPPLLGPLVFGVAAAMVALRVIEWGHCRNVAAGRALGVAAVLLFQLGFFQRSLVDARTRGSPEGLSGVPVGELVTGLPSYIALRMRNFELSPNVTPHSVAHPVMTALRWAVFAMELAALVGVGWLFGGAGASRPFAEKRRVWMSPKRFALPAGTGQRISEWLNGAASPLESTDAGLDDVVLLECDPKSSDEGGYVSILVGGRDARRSIGRRIRASAERLEELKEFLGGKPSGQSNG